jgi:hypothetical protein
VQILYFSASYSLALITPALQAQVMTKVGKDYDNGPTVWMSLMSIVQFSSYRGTKLLQRQFEECKRKNKTGENVLKYSIKLQDDHMRLFNANMIPHDVLMTIIDSLINSSTPSFAIWAATQ